MHICIYIYTHPLSHMYTYINRGDRIKLIIRICRRFADRQTCAAKGEEGLIKYGSHIIPCTWYRCVRTRCATGIWRETFNKLNLIVVPAKTRNTHTLTFVAEVGCRCPCDRAPTSPKRFSANFFEFFFLSCVFSTECYKMSYYN